jgi:uncharacterized protein (UPF0333 family)
MRNKYIFLVVLVAVITIVIVLVSLIGKKTDQTTVETINQNLQIIDEGESFDDSQPLSEDLFR